MTTSPYRLQIFVPDPDVREALKEISHREKTSLQKLIMGMLLDKLDTYPEYEKLAARQRREASPA